MKSSVMKRSVILTGHKTSVSLEDEFWKGLREIAHERDMTPSELISVINADRQNAALVPGDVRRLLGRDSPSVCGDARSAYARLHRKPLLV